MAGGQETPGLLPPLGRAEGGGAGTATDHHHGHPSCALVLASNWDWVTAEGDIPRQLALGGYRWKSEPPRGIKSGGYVAVR